MRPPVPAASLGFVWEQERAVDDFVFLCMLVGNDFLPGLPSLDVADGALNMMMRVYTEALPELGGYLTHKGELHMGR
jgi:5'-3' exonuclease